MKSRHIEGSSDGNACIENTPKPRAKSRERVAKDRSDRLIDVLQGVVVVIILIQLVAMYRDEKEVQAKKAFEEAVIYNRDNWYLGWRIQDLESKVERKSNYFLFRLGDRIYY